MQFHVTPDAGSVLREHLAQLGNSYIAAIVWAEDEAGVGAWEVGFHLRATVPVEWIESLDHGIELVIEPHWREQLDGKILEARNGYLMVDQ
jgi:hypothetical protein